MTRRARAEDGMTLVEVLVAALVLVFGILGTLTMFDFSTRLNSTSQREAQATSYAQREVERLRSLPYDNVALPAQSGDAYWGRLKTAADPLYVSPLATETLVTSASNGQIEAVGTWQDDRMATRGRVHRYVTEGNDPAIPSGTQPDFKRIVVAVTVDGAGALPRPIVVMAVKTDPNWSNRTRGTGGPCLVIGVECPG